MSEVKVQIVKLHQHSILPKKAHPDDAGFDLFYCPENPGAEGRLPVAGSRGLFPTGVCIAIPPGYEGEIRPRSGNALNYGVTVLNAPGTIDSGFRGEVMVMLVSLGSVPFIAKIGDKIAQIVFNKIPNIVLEETDRLDETPRGVGGFGSTDLSPFIEPIGTVHAEEDPEEEIEDDAA